MRVRLRLAGVDVVAEAGDGKQAVRSILEAEPDVVVLDQRLPDFNGDEVFRRIRSAGSSAKVVIYSGSDPTYPTDTFVPAPHDPYVVQGFDVDDLVAAIHRVAAC